MSTDIFGSNHQSSTFFTNNRHIILLNAMLPNLYFIKSIELVWTSIELWHRVRIENTKHVLPSTRMANHSIDSTWDAKKILQLHSCCFASDLWIDQDIIM